MEPKNGDFAKLLDKGSSLPASSSKPSFSAALEQQPQAVQQSNVPSVVNMSISGEEFSEAMLDDEKFEALAEKLKTTEAELENIAPLSDEELERQALEAGGSDNDPDTPE